ncbi:MAG: type II toxin-antitoxin system Phd/YefM family antitoxin [Legionellales bacterium]|jgi:prevent-host-death family protein
MNISLSEDIHSITELKRNTKALLDQMHQTGRPIVLTQNGKANAVMMDVNLFEKYIMAKNMAALLQEAEEDIKANRTMDAREFIKQFKDENKISG